MKLKDKVALVTGASRGIGRGIALALALEGAEVVVNYAHAKEDAEKVMAEITALGRKARAIKADVSRSEQVQAMFDLVIGDFGRLDILVNNAGVAIRASLKDLTEDMWDRVLDVNLKGTFLCSKLAAEMMIKQRDGRIVNISSMRAVTGSASSMHYAAAKAGVIALTKCLALELAPAIRVNAIAPGYIETDLHAGMSQLTRAEVVESTPLKRFGQPEDVAKAVVFLASDDSAYLTGHTLLVDGGRVTCY